MIYVPPIFGFPPFLWEIPQIQLFWGDSIAQLYSSFVPNGFFDFENWLKKLIFYRWSVTFAPPVNCLLYIMDLQVKGSIRIILVPTQYYV